MAAPTDSLIFPTAIPSHLTSIVNAATEAVTTAAIATASAAISAAASGAAPSAAVSGAAGAGGAKPMGPPKLTPEQQKVKDERAVWTDRMTFFYLIICGAVLIIYLLLDHPRIVTRLVATPIRKHKGDPLKRRKTGGEFWNGFFLRSGKSPSSPAGAAFQGYQKASGNGVTVIGKPGDAYPTGGFEEKVQAFGMTPLSRETTRGALHAGPGLSHMASEETLFYKEEEKLAEDWPHDPIAYTAPIYASNRTTGRPMVPKLVTTAADRTQLVRQSSTKSFATSIYSQESTAVEHEPFEKFYLSRSDSQKRLLEGDLEGKQLQKIKALHSAISAPSANNALSPASYTGHTLFSAATEKPLLSAVTMTGPNPFTGSRPKDTHALTAPPHMPKTLSRIPGLYKAMLWVPFPKLFPHLTAPALFLLVHYFALVAFCHTFKAKLVWTNDPLGNEKYRWGMIATVQVPIIIGIGGRNSMVRYLIGGSDNRTITMIHKFAGRLCFIGSTVHVALFMYGWNKKNMLAQSSARPFVIYGYIAFAGVGVMTLTSLPFIRKRIYSLFMISHLIGLAAFLLGLAMHVDDAVPYVAAGGLLYAAEMACRFAKTRVSTAELKAMPGADSTLVTVEGLRTGWRAGQHVVLRVPGLPKTGGLRFMEGHCFTIASAPGSSGLVLIAKRNGDWTRALFDMAANTGSGYVQPSSRLAKVMVEGPYGGPGHNLFASYSCVMLLAGGSGVTHTLGVAHDLISKALNQSSIRATYLDVVWVVRTEDAAKPLMSTFQNLLEEAKKAECKLAERLNAQGAPAMPGTMTSKRLTTPKVDITDSAQPLTWTCGENSKIKVVGGSRPNVRELLEELIDSTVVNDDRMNQRSQGCGVAVCGPGGLVEKVRADVKAVDSIRRVEVGGIELLEEHFES